MTAQLRSKQWRSFLLVWAGQLVSLVGSSMTSFALAYWVLERTGSNTQFTLIAFFGVLPGIAALPVAGALVDRWGGRRAMIIADLGEVVTVLAAAVSYWAGSLTLWQVYALAMVDACFGALRWPAYSTLPPLLVPEQQLDRANGMVQSAEAAALILAPVLGGLLVTSIGLDGVMCADAATYACGLATLGLVRVAPKPDAGHSHGEAQASRSSITREIAFGWQYIRSRPGLSALLVFFAVTNFTVLGLARTLFTPLILKLSSPKMLGLVLSVAGVGSLLGAITLSVWGGPKRRIQAVLGFTLVQGVFIVLGGIRPNLLLVGSSLFMLSFCFPIVTGSSQALWQRKVAAAVQGRVFSVRRMLGWSSFPVAYAVAGPLADYVFEPLLSPSGALAGSVGRVIGVGGGRGIAFLFILIGLFTVAAVLVSYRSPRLRWVEDELPDAFSTLSSPEVP